MSQALITRSEAHSCCEKGVDVTTWIPDPSDLLRSLTLERGRPGIPVVPVEALPELTIGPDYEQHPNTSTTMLTLLGLDV